MLARLLAEEVALGRGGGPVDQRGIDLRPLDAVEDADVVVHQVVGVSHVFRNDVALDDRGRDLPVGIEVDVAHLAGQRRRRPLELAHHDVVARIDMAVLDRLELGGGNVDEDGVLAGQVPRIGFDARQVLAQHAEAGVGGHVELGQGLLGDDARGQDAMVDLEGLHRVHQFLVIGRGGFGGERIEGQVVLADQPLAQRNDGFALGTLLQRARGKLFPAAARHDFLIHGDGALHRGQRVETDHRRLVLARDDFRLGCEAASLGVLGRLGLGRFRRGERTGEGRLLGKSRHAHGQKTAHGEKAAIEGATRQHGMKSPELAKFTLSEAGKWRLNCALSSALVRRECGNLRISSGQ